MQRDYLTYPGSSLGDNWVQIADDAYVNRVIGSPSRYRWNVRPEDIGPKTDLCVHVISEDPSNSSLPTLVRESSAIVYLAIPLRFVPHLKPGDIPSSVKTLVFHDSGRFQIPSHIELQQVERVTVAYGELIFEKRNFPQLQYLHLKLDRKGVLLNRLPSFERLRLLSIHPCSSSMFSVLDKLRLGYLRLNNSRSETLEGIERLETLTDLWLQGWSKLTDLSPLARLPLLEDLTLTYCKRIVNATALLEIPSLRRLFVWECKNKVIEALKADLAKRNLEELSIS